MRLSNHTTTKHRWHKEGTTAYHETLRRLHAKRQPMAFLDRRFRISKANPSAPTMHFGLEFTHDNIMYCAHKRRLLPPILQNEDDDPEKESRRLTMAAVIVKDYLERSQRVMLALETPVSPEGSLVFSLYSNYTRRRLRRPNTEKLILNFMREELNMGPEHTAKWYWDMDYGTDYKSQYAEFNL